MSGPAFSSIAIGIDVVHRDERVIDRASRLPLRAGALVTLTHVLARDAERLAEDDAVATMRALGAVVLARRPDVTLDVVVCRGEPGPQLARSATDRHSELLVVGCGAHRRRLGMPAQTTAERASRSTDVPVLAVRTDVCASYRRLLAGIESPGEVSALSIETACRLLADAACEGRVLHPLDDAIDRRMRNRGAPGGAVITARRWRRSRLKAEISAWLGRTFGGRGLRVQLERGDPSASIIDCSRRLRSDLLVLGVGHRWLRGRFLRPSVVGAVLAHADGDVLIVRTERARAARDRSTRAAA